MDLGATNFRLEPSFTHPCVVLAGNREFILVVPCSSKKYNTGYPEIIDGTPEDGFSCNTGIQTQSFRWIGKNRVISVLGNVSTEILNKIDDKMLNLIPTYSRVVSQKDNEIKQLKKELEIAQKQIERLNYSQ